MLIDAVVLDIDGVLIDTGDSYDRAIRETLRTVIGETITDADIQAFKNAGGFNNDWALTEAAAAYLLARQAGFDCSIDAFTDAIAQRGGGRDTADEILADAVPSEEWAGIERERDPELLRRTFQWFYLGPDRFAELESVEPPPGRPTPAGFIDDEQVLVTPDTLSFLADQYPLGVLTGRPAAEAAIALDRSGLAVPPDRRMTMDDWAGGKPDPAGLIELATRMNAETIVFIGDELDDVRTAVRAQDVEPNKRYLGIGVQSGGLTGETGRERFQAVGAAAVLADVNELSEWLRRQAGA